MEKQKQGENCHLGKIVGKKRGGLAPVPRGDAGNAPNAGPAKRFPYAKMAKFPLRLFFHGGKMLS
jgi:hypothetical protein